MQCEYKATQKFNLRMHVQLKHEGFVYSCDQCDYKASYKHAFRIHKQSIHEDIKFDCEQWEYKATKRVIWECTLYRNIRGLNSIVISVSTKQQPRVTWECTHYRNMKTSYKQTLRFHNQSKHGDIKFDCDQCEYKATTKSNLRVHKLSKHVGIIIDCDQCVYKATQKSSLSNKKSKHEGIKSSEYKATIKSHLRVHTLSRRERIRFDCDNVSTKQDKKVN